MRSLLSVIASMGLVAAATGCGRAPASVSLIRSLTGDDYAGKKYYFGWGRVSESDTIGMHNEVKYDILHTHDIFVSQAGGSYLGTKAIDADATRQNVLAEWQRLDDAMTADDMFVQYSAGHGRAGGLMVGILYSELRDRVLNFPAKEIIVISMACESGGMIDQFNAARDQWAGWGEQGRTLFAMSSSATDQLSSTGPGTDPDEPAGADGSAGSAFGYSLWKALIGYADGFIDGVKDGYLSLDEIVEFTKWKTHEVGGHDPQVTGIYNGNVLMNRVPPPSFRESLEGGTEGLSDAEVAAAIQSLDLALRL